MNSHHTSAHSALHPPPQFKSALRDQSMVSVYLELCKVYVRLDVANTALEWYKRGAEAHPGDTQVKIKPHCSTVPYTVLQSMP